MFFKVIKPIAEVEQDPAIDPQGAVSPPPLASAKEGSNHHGQEKGPPGIGERYSQTISII